MIYIEKIRNLHVNGEEDVYPYSIPFIRRMTELAFRKEVTFIVGENGSGKSTLVEAIAVQLELNPEGGSKNFNFQTVATHSDFFREIKIIRGPYREKDAFFLRAESFYNVASEIDRLAYGIHAHYGGKSLHEVSHGESFLNTFLNRLGGGGVYLLDEPEAALSPVSIFRLMVRMKELIDRHSQFIIATHSPLLLAYPRVEILTVDEDGIHRIDYEDTEPYRLTKYVLNNHRKFMEDLLKE